MNWWKMAKAFSSLSSRANGPWVLGYHRISDELHPGATSLARFDEHLALIESVATVLPLEELLVRTAAGRSRPDELAITFDDGYRDQEVAARKALARGLPATIFIPTAFPDSGRSFFWEGRSAEQAEEIKAGLRRGKLPPDGLAPSEIMSWSEIRSAANDGIDIQSHSHDHRILSSLTSEQLEADLATSVSLLQEKAIATPRVLAYPNGDWPDFSLLVDRAAEKAGLRWGLTAVFGTLRGADLPWRARRLMIANETADELAAVLRGGKVCSSAKAVLDRVRGRS